MEKKKTVVVYESFYQALQLITTAEAKVELFNGMMEYGFTGEEPNFTSIEAKLVWITYKPNMDANMARYNKAVESGRKSAGNRNPKKVTETSSTSETKVTNETSSTNQTTSKIDKKALIHCVKLKNMDEFNEAAFIRAIENGEIENYDDINARFELMYIPKEEENNESEVTLR